MSDPNPHEPTVPEECAEAIRQTGGCEHGVAAPAPLTGTWEQESDRIYRESVAHVAQRLRDLAAEVERDGLRISEATEGHTLAAGRVVHSVTWGLANLNLDGLIRRAADATGARAEARR